MAGGDDQAFVGSSLQRSAKIPDFRGTHTSLPTFALKIDLERYKTHAQHTHTIDSTVTMRWSRKIGQDDKVYSGP